MPTSNPMLQAFSIHPPASLSVCTLAVATGLLTYACEPATPRPETPNVLLIHVDDLGWNDLGFMGSDFYETPHLDNMATESLVFMHAYAGAANCAPSRANLLTGMNTPRHDIYTVSPINRGDARTRRLEPAANADSLHPDMFTLAHLFGEAGYETISVGKWHLSMNPVHNGFDRNVGGDIRGNPGHQGYFAPYNIAHITQGPDGEYLTDRLTSEAIDFMREERDAPFFVYMTYYTPHTPLMGKPEIVEKYRQKEPGERHNHPVYAAMVESMDENVGRLLATLDQMGVAEQTIVIFISDNGGLRQISPLDPLRAGKGSYFEGGIRVPLLMRWPGRIAPDVTDTPVTNLDFFATFAEILGRQVPVERLAGSVPSMLDRQQGTAHVRAGEQNGSEMHSGAAVEGSQNQAVTGPEGQSDNAKGSRAAVTGLDGTSLVPLFQGGTLEQRPLFWHFPIYLEDYAGVVDQARDPLFRTRPGSIVRYGDWKLHEYFEDGALKLYNLVDDPGEWKNLAGERADIRDRLHSMLVGWREETGAIMPPGPNPQFDPELEAERIEAKVQAAP